jgi:hypothetical protein
VALLKISLILTDWCFTYSCFTAVGAKTIVDDVNSGYVSLSVVLLEKVRSCQVCKGDYSYTTSRGVDSALVIFEAKRR